MFGARMMGTCKRVKRQRHVKKTGFRPYAGRSCRGERNTVEVSNETCVSIVSLGALSLTWRYPVTRHEERQTGGRDQRRDIEARYHPRSSRSV